MGDQAMTNTEEQINPLFLQLVLSLQSAAWYQMGKTVSPISGKIERDLDQAKASIDLLAMLQEKTKGNLGKQEQQILDNTVYTLQMNYVDELGKGPDKSDNDSGTGESTEKDDTKKSEEQGADASANDKSSDDPGDKSA
jgi:hypothetical protein